MNPYAAGANKLKNRKEEPVEPETPEEPEPETEPEPEPGEGEPTP